MKTLPPALAAHLASGATNMAYCWRLTRRDGTVLGFTEHDRDIAYAGTAFAAASGFTASQIAQGLGLSVDNMEAQGALSAAAITETDLLAGRYDDAVVELFWVNWADPSQGVTIAAGNIGEVKRQGLAFSAEFRSLANRLIDHAICGAADHHMALALVGKAQVSLPGTIHPNYVKPILAWQERAERHLGGNIGFIPGTIEHGWHGAKAARRYIDRWSILTSHAYDPERDIKSNTAGVIELTGNKPGLKRDLWRYFRQRDEDATTL